MNLFAFLLCCIAVPPAFGNNVTPQDVMEMDRARSSWNFGGQQPIKKSAYWNRPRNVAGPGSVLANRRMGTGSTPMAPYRKISQTPSAAQQPKRRQHKPYPKSAQQGKVITKRHTNFPFSSQPGSTFPQSYPISYFSNQQQRTPAWHRSSRKLRPTVDTIKSRFMKEDLWHLDKGESYVVKDEDFEKDSVLRNRHYESNDIDAAEVYTAYDEDAYQLEKEAENMVNQVEKANSEKDHSTPQHIHHHHHYENVEKQPPKPDAHKMKPAEPSKVVAAPLPRIHNPIPLGCLLAVPVFHPIRPRHHLACLLSIPGTPSLTRRRRRRSADLPTIPIPASSPSQGFLQQLFGGSNSKMTPIVTRKHYASHVGNGKNPGPPGAAQQGNFKVPATIIAPPKFDKDDLLAMLLGSGGVSAETMGTVVATNNRYVRYGRGLPNGHGTRQGRHINWMPDSQIRAHPAKNIPQSSVPVQTAGSNHIPSVIKSPAAAKKPVVHLTPYPKKSPVYVQKPAYYPSNIAQTPLILNVQISPSPMTRAPSGPVITLPIQQQAHHQHANNINEQLPQNHQPASELADHHHDHHDHDHFEEQPTASETPQQQQPQEPLSTSESQTQPQQQPSGEEQSSTPVPEQQQPPVSVEEQQQEQQVSAEDKAATVPFQTVVVSPSGKSQKLDTFKYTEWSPVDLGKPQPQKAYYYEYYNGNPEPSESKSLYRKVKPFSFSSEKGMGSASSHYESINDQLDDGITDTDSLADYYHILNLNQDLVDKAAYLKANSWQDSSYDVSKANNVAYAVKKNYKDELDNVLQAIASRERGIYSDAGYPEINDVYDSRSSSYADSDNSVYSHDKYYTAQKLPTHVPDPIYISVPKDDEFSNELYDVKK